MLDKLIGERLLIQEAKKLSLEVKNEEIEKQIDSMLSKRGMTMDALKKELATDGISLQVYKSSFRDQLTQQRIVESEIISRIVVSDEEIGSFFGDNRRDYEGGEALRIRQIVSLFPSGISHNDKMALRGNLTKIRESIQNGESFEELAVKYSQGTGAAEGGDIGFVRKDSLFPEIDSVVSKMSVGDVSDIIESPMGYHIIKVAERRGGKPPVKQILDDIIRRLRAEKVSKKVEEYVDTLRKKAIVDVRL